MPTGAGRVNRSWCRMKSGMGSLIGEPIRFRNCVAGQLHMVRTTRNSALPLIMRAYASAAFSSG
jgi:hypothetical protein